MELYRYTEFTTRDLELLLGGLGWTVLVFGVSMAAGILLGALCALVRHARIRGLAPLVTAADVTVFFARIGDQTRFCESHRGNVCIVSYARTADAYDEAHNRGEHEQQHQSGDRQFSVLRCKQGADFSGVQQRIVAQNLDQLRVLDEESFASLDAGRYGKCHRGRRGFNKSLTLISQLLQVATECRLAPGQPEGPEGGDALEAASVRLCGRSFLRRARIGRLLLAIGALLP